MLVEMGLLETCPRASFKAAPHLHPKESKAETRTMIEVHAMNAATQAEQWPMPFIGVVLSNLISSTQFQSLYVRSEYEQRAIHPSSYGRYGIMALQGPFVSTCILRGLKTPFHIITRLSHHFYTGYTMHLRHGLMSSKSTHNRMPSC